MRADPNAPKHIVIVGGGSAGWMTASLMQHAWAEHGTKFTLIESSDIGIIGVGEGSTPYMREFFRTLDIPESEWMPACNATYKCGISFPEWSTKPGFTDYFHPFFSQFDLKTGNAFFHNCGLRRRGSEVPAHPDDFFVSAALARDCRSPVPLDTLPFEPDYAYHFDAGLLGTFLKQRMLKLGLHHVIDNVEQVILDNQGNIDSLRTARSGDLDGDLFIDCSGFAGLLINKSLNAEFLTFNSNLFNDRAVAIATQIDTEQPIVSQTRSVALKHGWAWNIPLTSRWGNGYVYSSDFISEDQAEAELRSELGDAALNSDARHLKMRVGRLKEHWLKNCLAIGLSQGFIEPLEATALMLVQYSVQRFIEDFSRGSFTDQHRDEFNNEVNALFEGVRDYVVSHYQNNSREDSEYWVANRENSNISDNLAAIFHAWDEGLDFEAALTDHAHALVYLRPSWYCLLAGMGRFPTTLGPPARNTQTAPADQARRYCEHTARRFCGHREQLMRTYGESWKAAN
ncbi:MAG: tryptophan halogenase family protein [Halioglobus sp.]